MCAVFENCHMWVMDMQGCLHECIYNICMTAHVLWCVVCFLWCVRMCVCTCVRACVHGMHVLCCEVCAACVRPSVHLSIRPCIRPCISLPCRPCLCRAVPCRAVPCVPRHAHVSSDVSGSIHMTVGRVLELPTTLNQTERHAIAQTVCSVRISHPSVRPSVRSCVRACVRAYSHAGVSE